MSSDFGSARRWAERFILDALREGSTAIDATLGNGHDAERLCALVGETGHVFGFDVQKEAVERTRQRLADRGLLSRATLFCAGHERMAELARRARTPSSSTSAGCRARNTPSLHAWKRRSPPSRRRWSCSPPAAC